MKYFLLILPLFACGHTNHSLHAETNPQDKILAYFRNADQPSELQWINNRIVATQAGESPGHYMESCRKLAIRQGILDATQDGMQFLELSRRGSHYLGVMPESVGYEGEHVGAITGIKALRDGQASDFTYAYDLDDTKGACHWKNLSNQDENFTKRSDVELTVNGKIWPQFTERKKAEVRATFPPGLTDKEIAEKSVTRLLAYECEQYSLNQAALSAQALFRKKFAANPILFLDFSASRAESNVTKEAHEGLTYLNGQWTFRMANREAKYFLTARVPFHLKTAEKKCVGAVDEAVELY